MNTTSIPWHIFAETSPRAVQTERLSPQLIVCETIITLGNPGVMNKNKIICKNIKNLLGAFFKYIEIYEEKKFYSPNKS